MLKLLLLCGIFHVDLKIGPLQWFVNPGIDKLTLNNLREREVFQCLSDTKFKI